MRTLGPRLAAGFAAAGLLLSGCGGSPEPSPLPRPTASLSPSASATPTPPVMPEVAQVKTRAGAIAFARHFILTVNYAGAQGSTDELRDLYVGFCTRCKALADGIDQTYEEGGYFRGGSWTPTQFKFYAIKGPVAFVDVFIDYSAQEWVASSGAEPKTFPASRRNLKALNLRWSGPAGWKVSALDPNQ